MKQVHVAVMLILFASVSIGCSDRTGPGSEDQILAAQSSMSVELDNVALPSKPPVPEGGSSTGQPASWEQFMSLQAPPDQEYLAQLDHRYFGALSFRTDEEREYLSRNGFPTPEDWLAARSKTDDQLQQEADAGSLKAIALYADRMTVRLREQLDLAEDHPEAVTDRERVHAATMAVWYATRAESNSAGPLGPYLSGMVKSSIHKTWEPMTAAMFEGMRRGDPRVERLVREMHMRQPQQDVQLIHTVLSGMAADRR